MFANDQLEVHCIDQRMNHSHFIYMSLRRFQGNIKESGMSSELLASRCSSKSIMSRDSMNPSGTKSTYG